MAAIADTGRTLARKFMAAMSGVARKFMEAMGVLMRKFMATMSCGKERSWQS